MILTVHAFVCDVNKVSVLALLTQLIGRWIVEHAWSEFAATLLSVTFHDVRMIGRSQTVCFRQRTLLSEPDISRVNADNFGRTGTSLYFEALIGATAIEGLESRTWHCIT